MRDVALRAVAVAPDAIFTLPKPALPEAEKKEAATKKGKEKGKVCDGFPGLGPGLGLTFGVGVGVDVWGWDWGLGLG